MIKWYDDIFLDNEHEEYSGKPQTFQDWIDDEDVDQHDNKYPVELNNLPANLVVVIMYLFFKLQY